MKKSSIAALIFLFKVVLWATAFAGTTDAVESPKTCGVCGMDRTAFAKSRMLINYDDGASVGVCSIHCAAAELKQNRGRQVKSLMVADYKTEGLIDARTATWVIGGSMQGVMTPVAKWAFANEKEAQNFVKEYGGRTALFDQAMKAAEEEADREVKTGHKGHEHAGHNMGRGAHMLFNPGFGDDIYHTHPAGMWMFNYKFMRMNMKGLRDGTSDVGLDSVGYNRQGKPYNYMMIPTDMTMDMHMVMAMYGITDRLTVMAMASYLDNKMNMLMDMGPGKMDKGMTEEPPMRTSGIGDTEIRGIYRINNHLTGSLGLSLPTGSIDNEFVTMNRPPYRQPYDMQSGSGTYDLKPALTYSSLSDDARWNWGAQVMYNWHTGDNKNNWRYGDSIKVTGWLQRAMGPLTAWLRLAYGYTGRIKGHDPEIDKLLDPDKKKGAPMPDADPDNYGGQRLDGLIGVSLHRGPVSIGIEGGFPLYQNLNGLQMKTTRVINAGIQIMF